MRKFAFVLFIFSSIVMLLSACSPAATPCETADDLAAALREVGASMDFGEQIDQEFFSVPAQQLLVNDENVQVFAYATENAADQDANLVATDGASIGTTMFSWIDTPHFFECGKLIVLYLGHNPDMLTLLQEQLGTQFAGG